MYNLHVSTCCTQYTCTVQCTCVNMYSTMYIVNTLYNVHVSTCCTMYMCKHVVHVDNYRVSSGTLVVLLKTEKTVEAKPRIFSCLCCSQRAEHLQEYVVAGAERGNAHYSFETQINFKYLVNHHFKLTITHKLMARTCTNNLRVVFSPYVQHCPCEASEQKWGQKTNI